MNQQELKQIEREIRVRLKTMAEDLKDASEFFSEMTNSKYEREPQEDVEVLNLVMNKVESIFLKVQHREEDKFVMRDFDDLLCDLQEDYCLQTFEIYNEDRHCYNSTAKMVERVKELNAEAQAKEDQLATK